MQTSTRTALALVPLTALALLVPLVGTVDVAGAGGATVTGLEAPDFATEVYGDPWDFSNDADTDAMHVVEDVGGGQDFVMQGLRVGDALRVRPKNATQVFLLRSWTQNALPLGRDGTAQAVDAGRYDRLSIKATWTGGSVLGGGVFFGTCDDDQNQACQGAHNQGVEFHPGTHIIDIDLSGSGPFPSHPASWQAGVLISKLILTVNGPGSSGPTLDIDWMRLHDGDAATDRYPPGTTVDGATTYEITGRPQPVVLDPDLAGGDDYATTVRGDPWDMSQTSDIAQTLNSSISQGPGRVDGVSAAPSWNDPAVLLAMPEYQLNARRWHRLTVTSGFDGPFDLADAPGGGTHARWVHSNDLVPGGNKNQESKPIVLGNGQRTFTTDLHTDPVDFLTEKDLPAQGRPRWGWGGPQSRWVNTLRWDPHEDPANPGTNPGPVSWWLDDVRLARNDLADPTFDIRFEDPAWVPGETARVFAATEPGGAETELTDAPIAVLSGVTTFTLDPADLPFHDIWWIRVEISNGAATTSSWSTGPVETGTPFEFADIIPGDTFYPQVYRLVKDGIASGKTPDNYGGVDPVTRAQMTAFLYRVDNDGLPPACGADPFPDVAQSNPFCRYIQWAAAAGITTGTIDGTFDPGGTITRAGMAAFLYRAANGGTPPPGCGSAPFPDVSASHPFCGHIQWMAANSIAGGYGDGTYRPGTAVSRQAMAAFLGAYQAYPG